MQHLICFILFFFRGDHCSMSSTETHSKRWRMFRRNLWIWPCVFILFHSFSLDFWPSIGPSITLYAHICIFFLIPISLPMSLNARAFFVIRINTKNSFILDWLDLLLWNGFFSDDCSSCRFAKICVACLLWETQIESKEETLKLKDKYPTHTQFFSNDVCS